MWTSNHKHIYIKLKQKIINQKKKKIIHVIIDISLLTVNVANKTVQEF